MSLPEPVGYPDDGLIRDVLQRVRTIAVVGASPNPARPSHGVLRFLLAAGYNAIPVNPGHDGHHIAGQLVYARLADIPEPIDMVDVFRQPAALPALVDEVLALSPRPHVLWTQLGVINPAATDRAAAAGMTVVIDRCPAIEYPRLIRRVPRPAEDWLA
ncbi:MAG: CoA-binding protein [Bauldia sp.]|nr:CoA-binding protein [Bauldia sp.]